MENIIDTICAKADEASIRQAGQILKRGGLVAFPTETVYGLGADALNEDAAAKIYAAKGRPSDNPLMQPRCPHCQKPHRSECHR